MNITEHLQRATDDAGTPGLDLDHLARVARMQGSRARRRSRGVAVLGSVALVAGVALGSATLFGQGLETARDVPVSGTGSATPTPAHTPAPATAATGPFTGRGVTAGLRAAVQEVARGSAGAFAGQGGGRRPEDEAYGQLDWTDADGLGVSVIGINVQPGMDFVASCGEEELRCTRRVRGDGSTLTTYESHTPVADGVGIRRTADLLRADGTRVVISSTNGYDLPSNRWDVTRAQPPLTYGQLTRIVTRPWWGAELPTRLLDQGRHLAPYDDLGGDARASASPTRP